MGSLVSCSFEDKKNPLYSSPGVKMMELTSGVDHDAVSANFHMTVSLEFKLVKQPHNFSIPVYLKCEKSTNGKDETSFLAAIDAKRQL
jgi:hypothetical protein